MKNFVTVNDLTPNQVQTLINRAEEFKAGGQPHQDFSQHYCVNMFFENSTRTHTSFEVAERKLGLQVVPFNPTQSSINKGETLYDTLLTMDALGVKLAVIRHSQNEYYRPLIDLQPGQTLDIGIVNAGDGSGQHPSQCLLDMMTIHEQFGTFSGLKVAIVGDLTNSRVAKSNMELLNKLGATVFFAGPAYWYDPQTFDQYGSYQNLDELLPEVDVLMLLRVQHERHDDQVEQQFSQASYHQKYGLTKERYAKLKEKAIIMHPGPINRDVELDSDLVEAEKSRFKTQMQNGVFMRMAMLEKVLEGRA